MRRAKDDWIALQIGRDLAAGGKADMRSGHALRGYRPAKINGHETMPGDWLGGPDSGHAIVVRMPDGKVHMYLFRSHERARWGYDQAARLVEHVGAAT